MTRDEVTRALLEAEAISEWSRSLLVKPAGELSGTEIAFVMGFKLKAVELSTAGEPPCDDPKCGCKVFPEAAEIVRRLILRGLMAMERAPWMPADPTPQAPVAGSTL